MARISGRTSWVDVRDCGGGVVCLRFGGLLTGRELLKLVPPALAGRPHAAAVVADYTGAVAALTSDDLAAAALHAGRLPAAVVVDDALRDLFVRHAVEMQVSRDVMRLVFSARPQAERWARWAAGARARQSLPSRSAPCLPSSRPSTQSAPPDPA